MCISKTHQTHTFLRVCGARFRAQKLCLNPIGRTEALLLTFPPNQKHTFVDLSVLRAIIMKLKRAGCVLLALFLLICGCERVYRAVFTGLDSCFSNPVRSNICGPFARCCYACYHCRTVWLKRPSIESHVTVWIY